MADRERSCKKNGAIRVNLIETNYKLLTLLSTDHRTFSVTDQAVCHFLRCADQPESNGSASAACFNTPRFHLSRSTATDDGTM